MKQTGRREKVICKDGKIVKVIKISEILGDWGIPVIRERRALEDIQKQGVIIEFMPKPQQ
jgi:hypothetical protein